MIGALVAKQQVKTAFEYLNRKDLDAFLAGWDKHAIFMYPGQLSVSGQFFGQAEIRDWFAGFFRQFSSIQFQLKHTCVENLMDITGNNTVLANWDIKLTNRHGLDVENTGANLIRIRNRKVVEVQDFFFYQERLARGWSEGN